MAKALMFVGTSSESGKSVMAAAFCRILKNRGVKVAPFKAQNMALNSYVTRDGKEMGRAQVVQAEAAGLEPDVDMNPILLKPSSDFGSQVIIQGVVHATMEAQSYYSMKRQLWKNVTESYNRLAQKYDAMILEGAGSPVEMNLKDNDIVNMAMAEYADARVILVADIDRGGVFASILGTVELLEERERERLIGFIINKFRGDTALLRDGLSFIEQKTNKPVLGIVPYLKDLYMPGEDSVALSRKSNSYSCRNFTGASIGVIRLPHISNYTDFDPLEADGRFQVDYLNAPRNLQDYDVIILPGSKNVFFDLKFLNESGFCTRLLEYETRGGKIVGICGGYQMLGTRIDDPHRVEDDSGTAAGISLLPVYSIMETSKITRRYSGLFNIPGAPCPMAVEGYEIHMGRTFSMCDSDIVFLRNSDTGEGSSDICRTDGRVWGTYLHGLFESDVLRNHFIAWLTDSDHEEDKNTFSYRAFKEQNYTMLARTVEEQVNMAHIFQKIDMPFC
jgi:adenosylcobyric acid synthase